MLLCVISVLFCPGSCSLITSLMLVFALSGQVFSSAIAILNGTLCLYGQLL
jgi:hypothetical protein